MQKEYTRENMTGRERKAGPNLFEEEDKHMAHRNIYVPEASIYDEQPSYTQKREPLLQKSVTVFGYSSSNLNLVLRRFKEIGEVKEISYGKNWFDIKYEKEKCIYSALKENGSMFNGEMVGVVQKNKKDIGAVWITEQQVLTKPEPGIISKTLSYLFG